MEREYGHLVDREKNYRQLILDSVDQSLSRLGTDLTLVKYAEL